jgi:hypothetical protein
MVAENTFLNHKLEEEGLALFNEILWGTRTYVNARALVSYKHVSRTRNMGEKEELTCPPMRPQIQSKMRDLVGLVVGGLDEETISMYVFRTFGVVPTPAEEI